MIPKDLKELKSLVCFEEITDYSLIKDAQVGSEIIEIFQINNFTFNFLKDKKRTEKKSRTN